MKPLSTGLLIFQTRPILGWLGRFQQRTEETEMTRELPYYRLHIDLLRVCSALCLR